MTGPGWLVSEPEPTRAGADLAPEPAGDSKKRCKIENSLFLNIQQILYKFWIYKGVPIRGSVGM